MRALRVFEASLRVFSSRHALCTPEKPSAAQQHPDLLSLVEGFEQQAQQQPTTFTNIMPTQDIAWDEDRGGPRNPLNLISYPNGASSTRAPRRYSSGAVRTACGMTLTPRPPHRSTSSLFRFHQYTRRSYNLQDHRRCLVSQLPGVGRPLIDEGLRGSGRERRVRQDLRGHRRISRGLTSWCGTALTASVPPGTRWAHAVRRTLG